MNTFTVGAILNSTTPDTPGARVYVLRDGRAVFYVGVSSNNVTDRVLEHCGRGTWGKLPDNVGRFILDNAPRSHKWQVDLLTLEDCAPYVKKYNRNFQRWDAQLAEIALIKIMRPCLNVHYNDNGRALPKKYSV